MGMAHHIQPQVFTSLLRANWQAAVFTAVMVMLLVMVLLRIRIGINPDSLWLDDQWVASLAMRASPDDLFKLMPPAPIGFLLLLQVITSILGAGHWQMQLLPMLCGMAQIPLLGWIAWRATGRLSLGVLAAMLLSGSTTFLIYTLRVKQYTLEGLIALLLIAIALACLRHPRSVPFALVVLVAAGAIPLSFTAIPVGLVLVNVLALHLFLTAKEQPHLSRAKIAIAGTGYNAAAFGWLCLVQLHQANDAMYEYWSQYYAPVGDATAIAVFCQGHLMRFFTGGLPVSSDWLIWAVPFAIVLLCFRSRLRFIALAMLLFYGGMYVTSAMELYPLGARRTDIFSFPITILAIVAGIWAMSRYISFLPQLVLIIVIGHMVLFYPASHVRYPTTTDRSTVEQLVQLAQTEDGIVIGSRSSWAVGCYAEWPVELVRARRSTNGFQVRPIRPRTALLPEMSGMQNSGLNESERAQLLEAALDEAPPRIWFLSLYRLPRWVPEELASRGYTMRESPTTDGRLMLLER